jgi:hypothetical protein
MVSIGSNTFIQLVGASSCTSSPISISARSSIYICVAEGSHGFQWKVAGVTDSQGNIYYQRSVYYLPSYTNTEIWYTDGIPGVGTVADANFTVTVTFQRPTDCYVSVNEIIGAANPSPGLTGFATYGLGNVSFTDHPQSGDCFYLLAVTSTCPQFGTNLLTPSAPLHTISRTSNTPPVGSTIAGGTFGLNGPFTGASLSLNINDGDYCPNPPTTCVVWTVASTGILCCPSRDCAGICGGSSLLDCAGNCYLPPAAPPKVYDCAHVCGGTSYIDNLGQCSQPGSQSKKDSVVNPSSSKTKNCAGVIVLIILLTSVIILLITHRCDKK